MCPSLFFLIAIDSEQAIGGIAIKLSFYAFFLPLLLLFAFLGEHCVPKEPVKIIRAVRAILALLAAIGFAFSGFGYFVLLNAVTGSHEEVWVSGPVVKKDSYSGRYAGAQRIITIRYDGRDIDLSVTGREYDALKTGQIYGRKMKLGGLGYYCTWGISMWK